MYPKVSIVIPVYNSIKYTVQCIENLKKNDYPNYQIIVVDDGSTDNTEEILREKYPEVVILRGDGTLFWSGATNIGVKYVIGRKESKYLLTYNNDNLCEPSFLTELVKTAEENPDSIVGSMILYSDQERKDIIFEFGSVFLKDGIKLQGHNMHRKEFTNIIEVDAVAGRGALIPVKVFEKIGLYNEKDFPMAYGDYDFTVRARLKGYKLIMEPKSIIKNYIYNTGSYVPQNDCTLTFKRYFSFIKDFKCPQSLKMQKSFFWRFYPKYRFFLPIYYTHKPLLLNLFCRLLLGDKNYLRLKKFKASKQGKGSDHP